MLHYKPEDGYLADTIPFYWEGIYHLFYLKVPLEPNRLWPCCYAHIATTDFIHWKEYPNAITPEDQGLDSSGCWTGSIIEHNKTFYLFYTSYNKHDSDNPQKICLATSNDLVHWQKNPQNPILLRDADRFTKHWRDPFVFWYDREKCWMMSITTMCKHGRIWGNDGNKGALVIARSKDLHKWDIGEVFYCPGNHSCPECSDIFEINSHWYMLASFDIGMQYRRGDSPLGPFYSSNIETFDSRSNYAGKTIFDGKHRYLLGWNWTKSGCRNDGTMEWGGHLAFPREIWQESNGALYAKLPEQFLNIRDKCLYDLTESHNYTIRNGNWDKNTDASIQLTEDNLYGEISFPGEYLSFDLEAQFIIKRRAQTAGILIQNSRAVGEHPGYEIAIDMKHNTLSCREHTLRFKEYARHDIDIAYGQTVRMRVILEESILEVFVNDKFTLSARLYDPSVNIFPRPTISFFGERDIVVLKELKIFSLKT